MGHSFAVDRDGFYYIFQEGQLNKYRPDGTFYRSLGTPGPASDIRIGPDNRVYITGVRPTDEIFRLSEDEVSWELVAPIETPATPPIPKNFKAMLDEATIPRIMLAWAYPLGHDSLDTVIERRDKGDGIFTDWVDLGTSASLGFVDQSVERGRIYEYRVFSKLTTGPESIYSPTQQVIVPEKKSEMPIKSFGAASIAKISGSMIQEDENGLSVIASTARDQGKAEFGFEVGEQDVGDYVIWARVRCPSSNENSFFVSVDEDDEDIFDCAQGLWSEDWQWSPVGGRAGTDTPNKVRPRVFTMMAGKHTITFRGRDAWTYLSHVCITNDRHFVPTDSDIALPPPSPPPRPPSDDLHNVENLRGSSPEEGHVVLAWDDAKNTTHTGYHVQWNPPGTQDWPTVASLPPTEQVFRHIAEALKEGTTHSYRMNTFRKKSDDSFDWTTPTDSITVDIPKADRPSPSSRPPSEGLLFVSTNGERRNRGTEDSPLDLWSVLANYHEIDAGTEIVLREGTYQIPRHHTNAWYPTKIIGGNTSYPIVLRPHERERVILDGGLSIGDGTESFKVQDIEFLVSEGGQATDPDRPIGGLNIGESKDISIIHCILHHTGQAIAWWEDSEGGELCGNIIYDTGGTRPGRTYTGHGIYTQNSGPRKLIRDNIITGGRDYSLHAYGENGRVDNYLIVGNMVYQNRSQFLVGGLQPSEGILVYENYLYDDSLRIGYNWVEGLNKGCQVIDNVVWRGNLEVLKYENSNIRGNIGGDLSAMKGVTAFWRVSVYDPNRAHLAIYNWEGRKNIDVGAQPFLKEGDLYKVYRPEGFSQRLLVQESVYNGSAIPFRSQNEFEVYVVLKEDA